MEDQWPWELIAEDFVADGSWRDIYVLNTTSHDWQRVLDLLRKDYAPIYRVDGLEQPLPARIEDIFDRRLSATMLMSFAVDGVMLNCHFFDDREIEFDLNPSDVRDPEKVTSLTSFMTLLGRLLAKTVILTPENFQECPIFRYIADTDEISWIRPRQETIH